MPIDQDILDELKLQTRILTLSNADKLELEIAKYASTDDRKKIWALINASNNSQTIASKLHLTTRAVDIFLKVLEDADIIEREYGKPSKKILNFTPAKWLDLLPQETKLEKPWTTGALQMKDQKSENA